MTGRDDARWMALAIGVGRAGAPAPNPHVGAIVVASGRAIAIGWHAHRA
jgi:pyrimidine deaminase RibD-like protein